MYTDRMRVLCVGGGSVGHLAPAVAVAKELLKKKETEIRFVCSDRSEEARYLGAEGFAFDAIPIPRRSLLLPLTLLRGYLRSNAVMKRWKPDVVFSKGGAVSVPACLAARRLGIPIVLHESDGVMGRANRLIARWARHVCLGLPMQTHVDRGVVTGNPVRPFVTKGERAEGLRITGLSGKRPIFLVMGGSQGARAFNDVIKELLPELLTFCDVIHLTGPGKSGAAARPGYWSEEFAQAELPHLYAVADAALSRAGSGSIGELAACAIPTILVPLRGLAQDHQLKNARTVEQNGGAIVLEQDALRSRLVSVVRRFVEDKSFSSELSGKIAAIARPDAARQIASIIVGTLA